MTDPYSKACDEIRLNLYLDEELGPSEMAWMEAHLQDCPSCRREATTITLFAQDVRRRAKQAADSIDFFALEKEVLTQTRRRHHPPGGLARFLASLKIVIPATLTAALLIFLGYSHFIARPVTAPSAIIESFTGSVSSVMIFETPETRQTILWYTEESDTESGHNAG